MAVVDDRVGGRCIPGDYDQSVRRREAVAVGLHVSVPNGECGHGDIRILEDHSWLDLVHVYLPSGVIRVLQTFGPDCPVDFVSLDDVINHLLRARRTVELQRFLSAHNPGRDHQVGQAKRVIGMQMREECDSEVCRF